MEREVGVGKGCVKRMRVHADAGVLDSALADKAVIPAGIATTATAAAAPPAPVPTTATAPPATVAVAAAATAAAAAQHQQQLKCSRKMPSSEGKWQP